MLKKAGKIKIKNDKRRRKGVKEDKERGKEQQRRKQMKIREQEISGKRLRK